MESARHVPSKIPSPTLSAASKDKPSHRPAIQNSLDVKVGIANADATSEGKAGNTGNDIMHSLGKKTMKNTDQSEATLESMNTKEPASPESSHLLEEGQDKLRVGDQGGYLRMFFLLLFLLSGCFMLSANHITSGKCGIWWQTEQCP